MKKIFVILILLLHGCSGFYTYQPPAPIYKKSQKTNPYIDSSPDRSKSVVNTKKTEHSAEQKSQQDPNSSRTNIYDQSRPHTKSASPAVLALVMEAEKSSKAGDLESAVSTIERALRIDSRNPRLTYKLAKLRLQQSKPRLAEDLAKKAALLSAQDKVLKRQSWLLISESRKRQNNYYGAKEAKLKADSI